MRQELHPDGLEIVTVALTTIGAEDARRWIEATHPEHPALIDQAHVLDELFGVVNVPSGLWIDEQGTIVRPAEPAWPGSFGRRGPAAQSADQPERYAQIFGEAAKIRRDSEGYVAALRDWVARGPESPFVLAPDEVIARSQPRSPAVAEAAAHFELGQHLYRAGFPEDAIPHFRAAHRLQPDNWTYRRQAWYLAAPMPGDLGAFWQGPLPGQEAEWPYESDWLSDVRQSGAENYYQPPAP